MVKRLIGKDERKLLRKVKEKMEKEHEERTNKALGRISSRIEGDSISRLTKFKPKKLKKMKSSFDKLEF